MGTNGMHLSRLTLDAVEAEYVRAHCKHSGHTPKSHHMSDGERLAILVEEVGEVARAITYDNGDIDNLVHELTQVTAMGAAWLEYAISLRESLRNGLNRSHTSVFSQRKFTGPVKLNASGNSDSTSGESGVSVHES